MTIGKEFIAILIKDNGIKAYMLKMSSPLIQEICTMKKLLKLSSSEEIGSHIMIPSRNQDKPSLTGIKK